jgi:hypothetical protein
MMTVLFAAALACVLGVAVLPPLFRLFGWSIRT